MKTTSVWTETKLPRFPSVKKSALFDVVVVGGGITGLTAAYLLKRAGKKVCVLERDRLASGDTALTTAHLTMVTDLRLSDMARSFGEDGAKLVWRGGATAIDTIEHIAKDENIDCEFRRIPGFLHAALNGRKDESAKLQEDASLARKLGFNATFVEKVPYIDKPGVRFANQAKFHPRAYLAGLAAAIDGDGSAIFENAEAGEVQDEPLVVKVGKHTIECDYVVIATHVPLMGKTGMLSATLLQTKIYPYSSYVLGAKVPSGLIPEASFWDTADPYYYLRVDRRRTFDYVIFGGEDHKTGQGDAEEHFARLQKVLLELIPQAQITHRWSGQVIETNDGLPYIGETSDRQFAATGFAGNGMTFGTLAALMARDAALGRKNPWQSLFDINRKKVRGGTWDYLKENVDYPWRDTPSLYKTVVSEFMLQQTQVKTVLPYFARWMAALPDFAALAAADEAQVLKLWEGLGYYSRARNLHRLARALVALPQTPVSPAEWLELPGIGPYTAAAVTSIALAYPAACVDGNVVRILARLTADGTAYRDSATAARAFTPLAEQLLSHARPGDHNQAMMELGATVCHRHNPLCTVCPVHRHCQAGRRGDPEAYPRLTPKVIEKKAVTRIWLEHRGALLLHRAASGARRLAEMHELPTADDLGLSPAHSEQLPILAVKKRGITRYAITETIRHWTVPSDNAAETIGSSHSSNLLWAPVATLEALTLSGPHRRWIREILLQRNGSTETVNCEP